LSGETKSGVGVIALFAIPIFPVLIFLGANVIFWRFPSRKRCRYCDEAIRVEATICPKCRSNIAGDLIREAGGYTTPILVATSLGIGFCLACSFFSMISPR
jgi:hypothetical protein